MALASISDYEAITGEAVPSGDVTRVNKLLAFASSAVLASAHGQLIEGGETVGLEVEPFEGRVFLPQRPVIEVSALSVDGVQIDLGDCVVVRGGNGRPAYIARRDGAPFVGAAVVSYEHGWDPVPGQIVGMVVAVAVSNMQFGAAPQPTQRTAGPFSESYKEETLQPAGVALTAGQIAVLDRLCGVRGGGSVHVPRDAP